MSEKQPSPGAGDAPQTATAPAPETPSPAPARADAKPAAPAPAAAVPGARSAAPMPLLIGVVLGALALGATLGALLVAPRILDGRRATPAAAPHGADPHAEAPSHGDAAHGAPAKADNGHGGGKHKGDGKGSVFRLDNLIVNPAGTQGTRFLMAAVAFEVPNAKAQEALRSREAQVRDAVISVLESQTLEQLTRPGARDRIKRELQAAVAPITGAGEPVRVYLPQFVLQ